MLFNMTAFFLTLSALAHGPNEAQTMAASLDEHARYTLPDPPPADCDAPLTVGPAELMGTGRIVFQTTMYATGMKTAFTIGTNTLNHPEVEDCVARVLKTVALPKPLRGVISLSIPVDFGEQAK